jgi:hypothetical protein
MLSQRENRKNASISAEKNFPQKNPSRLIHPVLPSETFHSLAICQASRSCDKDFGNSNRTKITLRIMP